MSLMRAYCFASLRSRNPSACLCGNNVRSRRFGTTSSCNTYEDTIKNLRIGSQTRVIFQGFTGKQATQNAKQSLEWGTNIVGGVTPGKDGEHLGLPVLPSMRAAMEQLKPDATGVYVAAHQAAKAIEEALEAEVPLIVAVAEFIPLHDLLRIHSMLRSQSKSRLVGANCPGIISPIGRCRIGFQPLSCFSAGSIGIIAKSGTLSYETVASTTRAGLGQSLVIGMGGDVVAGTNFVDALSVLELDSETKGIILVGEIGGTAELEAAEWIKDYRQREPKPKPIMALIGGVQAPPSRIMGHAGAFVGPGEADAMQKICALRDAGVVMTDHPAKFGNQMRNLLGHPASNVSGSFSGTQKRNLYTHCRRPQISLKQDQSNRSRRSLHISPHQALDLLRRSSVPISAESVVAKRQYDFCVTVDRTKGCPCITAEQIRDSTKPREEIFRESFAFNEMPPADVLDNMVKVIGLPRHLKYQLYPIIESMVSTFKNKEAFLVSARIVEDGKKQLSVRNANMSFDDSAFRVGKRNLDIEQLRNMQEEDADEVEAEKYGIVYIKLQGDGNIATLVNGAGLAMNTNDAVNNLGGLCTNFLDMGGKATRETVKASFQLVLRDPRVKTIFVNIFGGLTLCDMIAEGIMLAYKDLGISLPVVVRLRGTNEEIGQKMIAESGLPLHAFDDFEEAVKKAIELANAA